MREKTEKPTLQSMIDATRHLLAAQENNADFAPPSLLKEVLSNNASDTVQKHVVVGYAELGSDS